MYRTFDPEAWNVDTWFRKLKPGPKLLFIYLVTSPNAKPCGAYEIDVDTIMFQTGLDEQHVRAGFAALAARVTWFEEIDHVFVQNFYKRQRQNGSDTFRIAAARQATELPPIVRGAVLAAYPELADAPPRPKKKKGDRVSESETTLGDDESTPAIPYREGTDTLSPRVPPTPALTVSVPETGAETGAGQIQPTVAAPTARQVAQRAMFGALSRSFGVPTPGTEKKRYETAASELVTAGAEPSEIAHLREAWSWVNPGTPRVNSLAGQLTVLRNAQPRASPNGNGTGKIAQNQANLQEEAAEDGIDFRGIFQSNGHADAGLPGRTIQGSGRALPERARGPE